MKRFMYASIGVLALALAFCLGAMTAQEPTPAIAGYVDHTASGVIAWDDEGHMLDENGDVWGASQYGWQQVDYYHPPVPISEIKFWAHDMFLTVDNEFWYYYNHVQGWLSYGTWPGGPTPPEKTTWSKVKSEFK